MNNKPLLLLIAIGVSIAVMFPDLLNGQGWLISYIIGGIMLMMGMNLDSLRIKETLKQPKIILLIVGLRYLSMPMIGFMVSKLMNLPDQLAIGLILVGCCPTGVASNVLTLLSNGDKELSVILSTVNTMLAPILTPLMFFIFSGSYIEVSALSIFTHIINILIVPLIVGFAINGLLLKYCGKNPVNQASGLISTALIAWVISIIIAVNLDTMFTYGYLTLFAVMLHNFVGLIFGYFSAKLIFSQKDKIRATTFEVGVENSGLAVTIAFKYISPEAAIPGAIFSVWHNISGAILAQYWSKKDLESTQSQQKLKE